jgi:hypothetical protein
MDRCWLQGALGDALHALSCAAGYNIRWLLRAIARLGPMLILLRLLMATTRADSSVKSSSSSSSSSSSAAARLTAFARFVVDRLALAPSTPAVASV